MNIDKQHLAANIANLIGAGELVAQTVGLHIPNINVRDVSDTLAVVVIAGGTVWSYLRHSFLMKKSADPKTTTPTI